MASNKPVPPEELTGFTLFEGTKGWQMSYRRKGDTGWSVHVIDQRIAAELLASIVAIDIKPIPIVDFVEKLPGVDRDSRERLRKWLTEQETARDANTAARGRFNDL